MKSLVSSHAATMKSRFSGEKICAVRYCVSIVPVVEVFSVLLGCLLDVCQAVALTCAVVFPLYSDSVEQVHVSSVRTLSARQPAAGETGVC